MDTPYREITTTDVGPDGAKWWVTMRHYPNGTIYLAAYGKLQPLHESPISDDTELECFAESDTQLEG